MVAQASRCPANTVGTSRRRTASDTRPSERIPHASSERAVSGQIGGNGSASGRRRACFRRGRCSSNAQYGQGGPNGSRLGCDGRGQSGVEGRYVGNGIGGLQAPREQTAFHAGTMVPSGGIRCLVAVLGTEAGNQLRLERRDPRLPVPNKRRERKLRGQNRNERRKEKGPQSRCAPLSICELHPTPCLQMDEPRWSHARIGRQTSVRQGRAESIGCVALRLCHCKTIMRCLKCPADPVELTYAEIGVYSKQPSGIRPR